MHGARPGSDQSGSLGVLGGLRVKLSRVLSLSLSLLSSDPLQEPSWIKTCPDEQVLSVQLDSVDGRTDAGASAAQIKSEAGRGDCGASEPSGDFEAASGGRLLAEASETEDSGDYWREEAGLWRAEETEEAQGASSSVRSCTDLSQQPPPTVLSCKVCGESFQRVGYLLTHSSAHVRDCGLCGKHLELTESLKLHLRVHRETAFRCNVCGQSFTLRGNLRTHMRIHSGERPYRCTVCGKSFGRRATLVRHVRSHTGEKPFSCTYCGRSFVEKGNLTVHLRTHTGEKPYWCSTCDRRFSQLSCFYKHPCQRRGRTADGQDT
ncbi:endothelial zinc finger protein induced by tumor necrosis factor alpha-like [Larimichthys crocea]|uniref:endothelial zinc finger protein induced by tumor necrosis factor alpha-like n=1 Tax=Larimichthys crocea TaxID=215358 RepID=UPI000F5E3965|nr:endothelial zinc finger protein induced by tumor necrosis factor alpha-like [Larimichthys crocea]